MLDEVEVWPVRTNAAFLFNALTEPDFDAADINTGFIEEHLGALVPDPDPDEAVRRAAAAVAILAAEDETELPAIAGFRLNAPPRLAVALDGASVTLTDDAELAEVSGFRRQRAGRRLQRGQAYQFALATRGTARRTASTTARSRRRCRGR